MTSNCMRRSNSINNQIQPSSPYMKENFLFDKLGEKTSKDDTTIKIYQNPITIEQNDPTSLQPFNLMNHRLEVDALSNSSVSSKSSIFNDSGSCSSIDLSFDGTGAPFLKPFRTSAFAKVK